MINNDKTLLKIKQLKDILNDAIKENISIKQVLKHKKLAHDFFRSNFPKYTDNELVKLKQKYDDLKSGKTTSNLKQLKDILNYAIKENISIKQVLKYKKRSDSFFRDNYSKYNDNELVELKQKYDDLKSGKSTTSKTIVSDLDLNIDEKYDNRSSCGENRGEDGKIINYWYKILVRDEESFTGIITREQMDLIYQNYPYVTTNTCSTFFPYLTFVQFKRILRVFNITKEKLFPSFRIEEHSEEDLAQFALKAKENSSYKKFVEQKPIFIEKQLREVQKELIELKESRDWVEKVVEKYFNERVVSEKSYRDNIIDDSNNDKAFFLYLSDIHIGACNKGALLNGEYNKDVYYDRLKQIIKESIKQKNIHNKFDKVFIVGLGDQIDGMNNTTTRESHSLEQNMNNIEMFETYVDSITYLIDELHRVDFCTNIEFVVVAESNHGGNFEYVANLSLKKILALKYPNLKFNLFKDNIDYVTYHNNTFIYTHGKDNNRMSRNLPFHLDPKTDNMFGDFIRKHKIKTDNINVVKGDLHCYNVSMGKNITRYTNIPSIYGGSAWINANFGYTQPAFVHQIVEKESGQISETYVKLD